MDDSQARATAKAVLARALDVPMESVDESWSISTVEEWDSLSHLAVIAELEVQSGRALSIAEIQELSTFVEIANFLTRGQSDG